MKISKKHLTSLINEMTSDERDEPGFQKAWSELKYARPGGPSKKSRQRSFNKASRRDASRKIRFALSDIDGDGDVDLVNTSIPQSSTDTDDSNDWHEERFNDDQNDLDYYLAVALEIAVKNNPSIDGRSLLDIVRKDAIFNGITDGQIWDTADEMIEDGTLSFDSSEDQWYYAPDMAHYSRSNKMNESRRNKMSNSMFGREAIRDFFRDTMYEEPAVQKTSSNRRTLTEATDDYRPDTLEPHQVERLAQAMLTGILDQFEINMPPDKDGKKSTDEKSLLDQITYHMGKYPDLPAIIYELTMDAQTELGGDWDYDQAGNRVNVDDVGPGPDYDSVSSADGPTRDEIIELIAGHVLDAKTDGGWTGIFDQAAMMEFVTAMRDNGDIDIHDWNNHTIGAKAVRDRVAELEDEDDPIGDDLLGSDDEDDEDRGEWGGRGWL